MIVPSSSGAALVPLTWRRFEDLSVHELHAILKLRVDVFVVEQACPYAEIDGADPAAEHLLASGPLGAGAPLLATLRIFAPESGRPARVGRVAVAPAARGSGLGQRIMEAAVARLTTRHGGPPIAVSAQAHLERFYTELGFRRMGPNHDIDGIPHLDMQRG